MVSVGRTSLRIAPIALVSRGVAFFIPVAIAGWFGVRAETDAFWYALGIPTFLLVIASNAMGTVLVPAMAELRAREPGRMPGFVGAAMVSTAAISVAIGAALALAMPPLLPLVTRFDAETRALTVRFTWSLVPFLGAVGAIAAVRAACEVHGAFAASAVAPVVRAAVTLATTGALLGVGPMAMPAGLLAGSLAELIWLGGALRHAGVSVVPRPALPSELRVAAAALLPVLGGEGMVALNVLVDKVFASRLDEGAVSLLEYADRARIIPQTLLESSLLVVAFNAWAVARARGDQARHAAVARTLVWVLLLAPPVLAGMAIGRVALVRTLFEHGAFEARHTLPCAAALGAFVPGVLFSLLGALMTRAHIVEGRLGLVLRLGALSFALNAVLDAILLPYGLVGLAAATSVTAAVVSAVSFRALLPSLRGAVRPRVPVDVVVVVGGSLALGAAFVASPPVAVTDPALWAMAVPFVGLLGYGVHRVRAR